jgi:hypothetical protein
MGSRAARNRAQAALAREQALALRADRVAAYEAKAQETGEIMNPWRAPTLGEFFAIRRRNKQLRQQQQ